jgi:hypothetical protein
MTAPATSTMAVHPATSVACPLRSESRKESWL